MKIVCISDMHGMYRQIDMPEADILIVAGDILGRGAASELGDFNEWLGELGYPYSIVVAGNHDWVFQDTIGLTRMMLDNAIVLQDNAVILEGLKFYGSPWQPEFRNWAFNLPRNGSELAEKWEAIPDDTDILITHGPPWGTLDTVRDSLHLGCELLCEKVLRIKPKLHVFGHIHYSAGERVFLDTHYVNAAICTERYRPTNKPIVVEI